MVRGILDLVRAEDISVAPLELSAWITRVTEELTIAVGRTVHATHHSPVTVLVDADRRRHMITNLVGNAAEADDSCEPIEIEVLDAAHALVLDDEPMLPNTLGTMLRRNGWTVLGKPFTQVELDAAMREITDRAVSQ